MQSKDLEKIAFAWFEAFNTKQLDNLLDLYHNDAEHFSPKLKIRKPETNGLVKGRAALHEWWQDAFNRLATLHYTVKTLTASESRVFMEYTRQADGEEDMQVAEVLEIENGKIIASRVYHG